MAVQTQIQMRRGTASSWTSTNPILAAGEIGFESDTNRIKIGNGSSTWSALAYTASAVANTFTYTATAGQTTFSGSDANGNTLAYTVGAEQVYLNGVLLQRTSDYTATNGTSVVLASGAVVSDILTVLAFSTFVVDSDIPKSTLTAKGSLVTASAASTPANLSVGTDGTILMANSASASGLAYAGYAPAGKNAVINGGFDIWQRGTSIAIAAGTSASSSTYTSDRWQTGTSTNQACTISRQATGDTTNLPNIQYCMRFQRNSGQTGTAAINIANTFESVNSIPFTGKTVTLSFYARAGANYSATSNALNATILTGTGTDQNPFSGFTSSTGYTTTATLTTTWQRFTYTVTLGATITQLCVYFGFTPVGTAGAADYFEITGVQLELGSVATAFSRAGGTIQGELANCKRYYQVINKNAWSYQGQAVSANNADCPITFEMEMRVAPTVTLATAGKTTGTITFLTSSGGYPTTVGTLSANTITKFGFDCAGTSFTSAFTAGNATALYATNATDIYTASAEL